MYIKQYEGNVHCAWNSNIIINQQIVFLSIHNIILHNNNVGGVHCLLEVNLIKFTKIVKRDGEGLVHWWTICN